MMALKVWEEERIPNVLEFRKNYFEEYSGPFESYFRRKGLSIHSSDISYNNGILTVASKN